MFHHDARRTGFVDLPLELALVERMKMNQSVQLEYSTPLMKARALIPYKRRKGNFANTERKMREKRYENSLID